MEGMDLLRLARARLAAGEAVAECVVLGSVGSVARPAGARMLVLADGACEGTVGGGAPELRCAELAREVLGDGRPRRVTLDHGTTGMVCGGSQLVGIRRLEGKDLAALDAALACVEAGGQGWLETSWGDEAATSSFAPASDGEDLTLAHPSYDNGVFSEPLAAPERALVFGGGHVGRALVPVLAGIGFDVILLDDRPAVATPENFPAARQVLLCDYADVAASVAIGPRDCVCVMTHGHVFDTQVVAQVLAVCPRYLGCMGSRHKRAALLARLAELGFPSDEARGVELPIGLDIGAVTPAEIALSIAARLVEVRAAARAELAAGSEHAPCPAGS